MKAKLEENFSFSKNQMGLLTEQHNEADVPRCSQHQAKPTSPDSPHGLYRQPGP